MNVVTNANPSTIEKKRTIFAVSESLTLFAEPIVWHIIAHFLFVKNNSPSTMAPPSARPEPAPDHPRYVSALCLAFSRLFGCCCRRMASFYRHGRFHDFSTRSIPIFFARAPRLRIAIFSVELRRPVFSTSVPHAIFFVRCARRRIFCTSVEFFCPCVTHKC